MRQTENREKTMRQTAKALLIGAILAGCASAPEPKPQAAPDWNANPVYSIVDIEIRDGKKFGEYIAGHVPSLAKAGGRFIAAGGKLETVEGDWMPRRIIVHQWPSAKAFLDWYNGPEYRPWRDLRHSVSSANVVLAQGVTGSAASESAGPAFTIVDVDVQDGEAFNRYVKGHAPTIDQVGGRFLVVPGKVQVIEGTWTPKRLIVHRWPSTQVFKQWYDSEAYRPWKTLRHSASHANVVMVEGLSESAKRQSKLP